MILLICFNLRSNIFKSKTTSLKLKKLILLAFKESFETSASGILVCSKVKGVSVLKVLMLPNIKRIFLILGIFGDFYNKVKVAK